MKTNREYIDTWKLASHEYELTNMIDEVKQDTKHLTVLAILSLYQGRSRPSKTEVKKLLARQP